jgi:IS30 family transposase
MRKYQRLTIDEIEQILGFLSQGKSLRQIGSFLNRNDSTISRELEHFRGKGTAYKAWFTQDCSDYFSTERHTGSRIANNPELHSFIVEN